MIHTSRFDLLFSLSKVHHVHLNSTCVVAITVTLNVPSRFERRTGLFVLVLHDPSLAFVVDEAASRASAFLAAEHATAAPL